MLGRHLFTFEGLPYQWIIQYEPECIAERKSRRCPQGTDHLDGRRNRLWLSLNPRYPYEDIAR